MHLLYVLARLDPFHHRGVCQVDTLTKRELSGHIFGVEVPAWVIFHAMLGYFLLFVGLLALLIRLPFPLLRRRRWLHPYFGYTWIFGTIWMPVTAIWCVTGSFGWNLIAFFIFSMYAAIQAAWLFIQAYKSQKGQQQSVELGSTVEFRMPWKTKFLMIVHGLLMTYSFIMLLGAGISFPFRAYDVYAA